MNTDAGSAPAADGGRQTGGFWELLIDICSAPAVTVTLVVASIILVFVGTLAQYYLDMWEVIDQYFRAWICWVDIKVLFPPSFFPWAANTEWADLAITRFPFPGGALIGLGLVVNLVTAHLHRFKPEVRGKQLIWGLIAVIIGVGVTWAVIALGHSRHGQHTGIWLEWDKLWPLVQGFVFLLWIGCCAGFVYVMFKLDRQRRIERWTLGLLTAATTGVLIWFWIGGDSIVLNNSSLRILYQLLQAEGAALVLLFACYLLYRKRAGLVLLHAGIGLLMFGELFVSYFAAEQRMVIREGDTASYAQDIRSIELAVAESAGAEARTAGIPLMVTGKLTRYARGEAARSETLPFDIAVVKYFKNSVLEPMTADAQNLATQGWGLQFIAKPAPPKGGVSRGPTDQAAAYVRYTRKSDGTDLGTYLHAQQFGAQTTGGRVSIDGRPYFVTLRNPREYKPYRIQLIDVRKDDYVGTNIPRNYSSLVRLTDPDQNVDFEAKIWMNNPLRYAGETFYQSGYNRTNNGEVTVFQVVRNTGWMIPYVACMIVATGMLAHFLWVLVRFLRREPLRTARQEETAESPPAASASKRRRRSGLGSSAASPARGKLTLWVAPLLVLVVGLWWVGSKTRTKTPPPRSLNLEQFAQLPIMFEGRVKPIGTLARNSLRILSNRETVADADGNKRNSLEWLLDVIAKPQAAATLRVFRIDSGDVRDQLGLERRPGSRYSMAELQQNFDKLQRQVELARRQPPAKRSYLQRKYLDLEQRVVRYQMLVDAFRPLPFPPLPPTRDKKAVADVMVKNSKQVSQLLRQIPNRDQRLAKQSVPLAVPTTLEKSPWLAYSSARDKAYVNLVFRQQAYPDPVARLNEVFDAYAANDAGAFNRAVTQYLQLVQTVKPLGYDAGKSRVEAFYNHAEPFYNLIPLNVLAFVLTITAWLLAAVSNKWSEALRRSAFWLLLFVLVLHAAALVGRIYISGRPPVTNLYSSAVFIGWCCVAIGLIFEGVYRYGVGNCVASVSGVSSLLIAHFLAGSGDTIRVLQAVLDTQFWLTMHVLIVAFGYSAMFLAGVLGVVMFGTIWLHDFLLWRAKRRGKPGLEARQSLEGSRWSDLERSLGGMIYGTICFAAFASTIGTVLGGLWADDSWGRFWGWDPKENGALMIVLWSAVMLHAKASKLVAFRGLALLAVAGNTVTAWSWFGVNELGIGLHSYGFTEGMARALLIFWLSQLAFIAVGLGYLWIQRLRGVAPPNPTDDE